MNRRIFLDVGANTGQTLAAVVDPEFRFDEIVCFEPQSMCWSYLGAVKDPRVKIKRFGLWNKSKMMKIFEPGSKGAGLYKKNNGTSNEMEFCNFVQASAWFVANIEADDIGFLKLNVEGAECDIMDDLLDSGEFSKVTYAMIDFDVRKIASQKHREAELIQRLESMSIGFPRVTYGAKRKQVMTGDTHQERIKNWLRAVEKA